MNLSALLLEVLTTAGGPRGFCQKVLGLLFALILSGATRQGPGSLVTQPIPQGPEPTRPNFSH